MDRIKNKFENLNKNNKKALGIFLTAGYPNLKSSQRVKVFFFGLTAG